VQGVRGIKESTNHLFFGCIVAWLIWNLCYDWLGVSSIDLIVPGSHFKILDASTLVNLIMGNVWITLVIEIWRHGNNCLFKGRVVDHTKVFPLAQVNVGSLISSKVPSVSFSFSDWCLEPLVFMHSI